MVQGVTDDRFAMGYSGIGYKTSGVKNLASTDKVGGAYSNGSYEDVVAGKYPLTGSSTSTSTRPRASRWTPLVREFLKFIFSREGQEIVVKDGYYPLPAKVVKQELAKLREGAPGS